MEDELGDLSSETVYSLELEVSISAFRKALGNPKASSTVNVQFKLNAGVVPDAKYDEVMVGPQESLQAYLTKAQTSLVFTSTSPDHATFSFYVLPVKHVLGDHPCSLTLNPKPIIDKLKSVDGYGTSRVTITPNFISFRVTGPRKGMASTHRFACVEEEDADHEAYISHLANPSPERICARIGANSLRTTLLQMDPGDSATALGTMYLAGLFSKESNEARIALMLEMNTVDWKFQSGFTATAKETLSVIDFQNEEEPAKKAIEEGDVIAAAEQAMQEELAGEKDDDLESFHACAKQYNTRLQNGDIRPGDVMPLGDGDSQFNLVISEHFSPYSLLGVFSAHVSDMPHGVTLVFSKRSTVSKPSALVVVTPLASGCLGLHMMSYCRPDDE